jgi:hypothetical protein
MNLKQLRQKNSQSTTQQQTIPVKTGKTLERDQAPEGAARQETERGRIHRIVRRASDRKWGTHQK